MLILNQTDIKKLMSMPEAITASKEALRLYSEGQVTVPLRINIDVPKQQGHSLFMPACIADLNILGIKIVSVFPQNSALGKATVSGQMILMDGVTGEICALMDATFLTQLRTGALQGAATDILARKDAKTAVLFGTGGQAKAQLEALLCARPLEEIHVFGLNITKTQHFVAEMQKEFAEYDTQIVVGHNADKTIQLADIITTITNSKTPVFDGSLVKQGAHINGLGSYTPDMQELPHTLLQKADKILFDTKDGVLAEAGDILIPMQSGLLDPSRFNGDLGDIISGRIQGRETEQDITVFKSVGSAALDLVIAAKIYQKALTNHIGMEVP